MDDIRTEYHPSCCTPTQVQSFEDYGRECPQTPPPPHSSNPWRPFRTRADFKFAEIALKAGLNKAAVNGLIKIITSVATGESSFTLTGDADMHKTWDDASGLLTTVWLIEP